MIELMVIGATLALAAGGAGAQLHRRNVALRALAQYAVSRKHVFVPAPAEPSGASPRVEGEREDVAFVVDLYRLGGIVRTRVQAVATHDQLPKIAVVRRGRAYAFTSCTADEESVVRHVAGHALLLLGRRAGVRLACDGSRVSLSWDGIETSPLLLDAARDAVTALTTRLRRARAPYR